MLENVDMLFLTSLLLTVGVGR